VTDDTRYGSILVGGIALDNAYAGFTLGKVTNNEREYPGYGFTVAYNGRHQAEATLYVYNKGQANIGDGPLSSAVLSEFNQATREVLSLGGRADRKIELVARYGTGSPERVPLGMAERSLVGGLPARLDAKYSRTPSMSHSEWFVQGTGGKRKRSCVAEIYAFLKQRWLSASDTGTEEG
jgi:hypothetical protein